MIDQKEVKYLEIASKYVKDGIIIDVGGFKGNWTDAFLNFGLENKIIIFEPDLNNFNFLKQKYSQTRNIEVINKGASDIKGSLIYYGLKSEDEGVRSMSGFVLREIYSNYEFSESIIETIRIDSIIDSFVDFIKIDTEGFEFKCVKGLELLLKTKKVKFVQIEYGGTYMDSKISLNEIIEYFNFFGYSLYDIGEGLIPFELINFKDDYQYNNFLATYIKI